MTSLELPRNITFSSLLHPFFQQHLVVFHSWTLLSRLSDIRCLMIVVTALSYSSCHRSSTESENPSRCAAKIAGSQFEVRSHINPRVTTRSWLPWRRGLDSPMAFKDITFIYQNTPVSPTYRIESFDVSCMLLRFPLFALLYVSSFELHCFLQFQAMPLSCGCPILHGRVRWGRRKRQATFLFGPVTLSLNFVYPITVSCQFRVQLVYLYFGYSL